MTMPSVVVMPTRRPISLRMWAIMRTVVVLPFVPVTARIGMRAGVPGGKSRSSTGLRDVLRLALGGVGVHPEARRRVDLDDRAALLAHRHRDVGHDEVDAGDIQADHPRRGLGDLHVLGMRLERAVDGGAAGRHVAGQGELDPGPLGRDVVEAVALRAHELLGRLVHGDLGEHLLVADAAARIGVLPLDELAHGMLAVAGHAGRHALGDGRHAAPDDQAAVVVAVDVGFHDHVAAA